MDKKSFVSKLNELAPSHEDLKKRNLPDEFIAKFIKSYNCIPLLNTDTKIYSKDSIILLMQNFDCSNVEIGALTFLPKVVEKANYYQIGNIEQDILIINKILLGIEVLDYTDTEHTIWECASNSDYFLEALLICADFFTSRIKNPSLLNNQSYALERIKMCAEKAGGEKYKNFYVMLLGYDG